MNGGRGKQVVEDNRQVSNNTKSLTSIFDLRDQMLLRKQQNQEILKIQNGEEQNIRSGSNSEETLKQIELILAERKEKERLLVEALAETRVQSEKLNASKNRENKLNDKIMLRNIKEIEAVERARAAVQRRKSTGSDKSSPAVWAAVIALTQFVEGQDVSDKVVPEDIFRAIKQLTNFLDGEERVETLSAQQERLRSQILKQKQQQQQEIENILKAEAVTAFMNKEKQARKQALSVQQKLLREQVLRQKLKQEEEIENILSKDGNNSATPSIFVAEEDKTRQFPARIAIHREQDRRKENKSKLTGGSNFAFSTLPVF